MGVPIDFTDPGQTRLETLAIPLAQPVEAAGLPGRVRELVASGEFRGDRA